MDYKLKTFVTVARENSFSKAASILFMTQPAVTIQIKKLEEEYGIRLFDRNGSIIKLTEPGKVLYEHAENILKQYELAKNAVCNVSINIKGAITIGVSTVLGKYLLPKILGNFKIKYPNVNITMLAGDNAFLVKSLKELSMDIAIISEPIDFNNHVTIPFFDDEIIVIVNLHHVWCTKPFIEIDDLLSEPIVIREKGSGTREIFERYLKQNNINTDNLKIALVMGNAESVKSAVLSGVGYGIVSELALNNDTEKNQFKKININNVRINRKFLLVLPKIKAENNNIKYFVDFLLNSSTQI